MEENIESKQFLSHYRSFYGHILLEDIRIHLFPYRNEEEIIQLEASDESLEKLYFAFDSYRGGLHYQILEFLRYCATFVLLEGASTHEIVYFSESENTKPLGFKFEHIPTFFIQRKNKKILQVIPSKKGSKKEKVLLDQNNIVQWGGELGKEISSKRLIKFLAEHSSRSLPQIQLNMMQNYPGVYFDLEYFSNTSSLLLYTMTKHIGWNARDTPMKNYTESYHLFREIKFNRLLAKLREEMITGFNDALKKVGEEIGFSAKLLYKGQDTLENLEKAENILYNGGSIKEAYDLCSWMFRSASEVTSSKS